MQSVDRRHRLLGGDARAEGVILRFIADRYEARAVLHLPPNIAKEILKPPADLVRAAQKHCEPELNF